MAILFIMSIIYWARFGSDLFFQNWQQGQAGTATEIFTSILKGICLGFLAITGFETTPDYTSLLRPNVYPQVLLNLQLIA